MPTRWPVATDEDVSISDSIHGAGSATAPVAFQSLCNVGPLAGGIYAVEAISVQSGAIDANGANMRLFKGPQANGTGAANLGNLLSVGVQSTLHRERVSVPDGQFLGVMLAGANAGAGAIYSAAISVVQVG